MVHESGVDCGRAGRGVPVVQGVEVKQAEFRYWESCPVVGGSSQGFDWDLSDEENPVYSLFPPSVLSRARVSLATSSATPFSHVAAFGFLHPDARNVQGETPQTFVLRCTIRGEEVERHEWTFGQTADVPTSAGLAWPSSVSLVESADQFGTPPTTFYASDVLHANRPYGGAGLALFDEFGYTDGGDTPTFLKTLTLKASMTFLPVTHCDKVEFFFDNKGKRVAAGYYGQTFMRLAVAAY